MSYPFWITPPSLGSFDVSYSFTQQVLELDFGESSNLPCTVTLLNGALPLGITWQAQNSSVLIQGAVQHLLDTTLFEFTFRISNQTFVADRTFTLEITVPPQPILLEWITDTNVLLGTVYNANTFTFEIQAQVDPLQPILYGILNLENASRGISFNQSTGTVSVNLGWLPNTQYYQAQSPKTADYVFHNNNLYKCVISGTSSPSYGPLGTGVNIPDTDYPPWQANSYYAINSVVYNDNGKLYRCLDYGFSSGAPPGPQGTGTNISDGNIHWSYFDQAPLWDYISPLSVTLPINLLNSSANLAFAALPDSQLLAITGFFPINLISQPAGPIWLTPNTEPLVELPAESTWQYQLQAFDPDENALVYVITSSPGLTVQVSNIGCLYGTLPPVSVDTSFSITVTISDGVAAPVPRTFTVVATNNQELLYWVSSPLVGTSVDGAMSDKFVLAVTEIPGAIVSYGLSGGMLPPNIILNQQLGFLEGFLEFHAQDKTYYFEVTCSDGIQEITQQFVWHIHSQCLGLQWNISVPILGSQRYELLSLNNANIINDDQLYRANQKGWGRLQTLDVPLVSGIRKINEQDLKNLLSNYLHNFRLRLNYLEVSNYTNSEFQVVSLAVRDADTLNPWQPNTYYFTNMRVSGADGTRYICETAGTSGLVGPQGTGTHIPDGSCIWIYNGEPLPVKNVTWPLPWYPYHFYLQSQTVINNGNLYKANSTGYSGGGQGPLEGTTNILDNQISWDRISWPADASYNLFWPADVVNIRSSCVESVGYSNGWGLEAELVPLINSLSGGISSVTIVNPGGGYYNIPAVHVQGTGSGAQLQLMVSIINTSITMSTPGWALGDQIIVDLDSTMPAILQVSQVSLAGVVTDLIILQGGLFERVPSNNITLWASNTFTQYIVVKFNPGIAQVSVVDPGQGYTDGNTQIILGIEPNLVAQQLDTRFHLQLPVGFVQTQLADLVRTQLAAAANPFQGIIVPVSVVKITTTGIQWQGHARFDMDCCTFDGDQTRFVDLTPASQTVFDNNNTYWDNQLTTWNTDLLSQWPSYSQTIFEHGATIFDYYRTLFDATPPILQSRYSTSKFWYFGAPFDV